MVSIHFFEEKLDLICILQGWWPNIWWKQSVPQILAPFTLGPQFQNPPYSPCFKLKAFSTLWVHLQLASSVRESRSELLLEHDESRHSNTWKGKWYSCFWWPCCWDKAIVGKIAKKKKLNFMVLFSPNLLQVLTEFWIIRYSQKIRAWFYHLQEKR